jgi:hypothetical protein
MSVAPLRIRCRTGEEARHIVSLLLSRKLAPGDIDVISAEPLHDVGERISGKSRLPVFVIAGAVVGASAGWALAAVTARLYPLNTGGMPIVSRLPAGIVTYEAMMLLAILFAFVGMLLEARLVRKLPKDYPEHAGALIDGEFHVVARVASAEEAEKLQMAVETGLYGSKT